MQKQCESRAEVLQESSGSSAQVMLHRSMPMLAPTDANTRIDRCQCWHRPMQHDFRATSK